MLDYPFSMEAFQQMVGERIGLARKEAGLTQEQLAESLGFKDRQILSNIESGKRKVSSEELLRVMEALDKNLDYFTDPALVVGEQVFSWRTEGQNPEMQAFESWALNLVGAHRQLVKQLKEPISPLKTFLPLEKSSTFEEAAAAGEGLAQVWKMGEAPAPKLRPKIEQELKVMVLPVDAPEHVSGGAVNLPQGATIFINRNHCRGRRHFTLAHELFHILTWQNMPPEKFDFEQTQGKRPRVEKLADNFAAALLMPLESLRKRLELYHKESANRVTSDPANVPSKNWFKETAAFFQVSVPALKFRLINAQLILAEALAGLDLDFEEVLDAWELYSKTLLDRLNRGIDCGFLSARKAAALLQTTLDDLAALLRSNDLEPSFSL